MWVRFKVGLRVFFHFHMKTPVKPCELLETLVHLAGTARLWADLLGSSRGRQRRKGRLAFFGAPVSRIQVEGFQLAYWGKSFDLGQSRRIESGLGGTEFGQMPDAMLQAVKLKTCSMKPSSSLQKHEAVEGRQTPTALEPCYLGWRSLSAAVLPVLLPCCTYKVRGLCERKSVPMSLLPF